MIKKLLYALLLVSLFYPSLAWPTKSAVAATQPSNIVVDGNMEMAGLAVWKSYGYPLVDKVSNVKGSQVIHFSSWDGVAGVQQLNVPVMAGRTYQLSYDARIPTGILRVVLGNNNSNADYENKVQFLLNKPTWQTQVRSFVAPSSTNFRLVFSVRDGEAYLDNVKVVEVGAANPALAISSYGLQAVNNNQKSKIVSADGVRYLVFGDSLSDGYIGYGESGYPGNLAAYPKLLSQKTSAWLNTNSDYQVVGGAGARIDKDVTKLPYGWLPMVNNLGDDKDVIVIWIGINHILQWAHYDSSFQRITADQFKALYQDMITQIKNKPGYKGQPIVVGTLHDISRLPIATYDGWGDAKKAKVSSDLASYNKVIRDIAAKEGLTVVNFDGADSPMYKDEAANGGLKMYQADGIHPNAIGQQLISDRWWQTIRTLF